MDRIVLDTLQEQFNRERFNHATYRALAASLDAVNWAGSAAWMLNASNEEQEHADKFAGYIVDRNEVPRFDVLPAPLAPVGDDLVMFFDAALKLEVMNTAEIKELHYAAEQSEDMQTCTFLIWAIEEQTKAERELTDILLLLRRLDNNGRIVFDKELK